ncbi:ABC transporter ATP-binding protein [Flavobacterium sp.]|jgi:subfamily B ATP-binding cassette protein MsbA|uniref:ABC transporter ATP-binding protein n=1 Tax=Flavobacterium sp. TaxID=239 RepID=UPI0035B43614
MIKSKLKEFVKTYFKQVAFFYSYLRARFLYVILISFFVSLFDALSLSVFIPLFEIATDASSSKKSSLTNYLQDALNYVNLPISVNSVLVIMLVFFFTKAVFRYADVYYRAYANAYFIKKLRIKFVNLISSLEYNEFIKIDLGKIQNSITTEVVNINSAYTHYISVVQNSIFIIVYIVMSFLSNTKFTLIVIVGAVVSKVFFGKIYSNSKILSFTIAQKNSNLSSLLMQFTNNFKYLKSTATVGNYSLKLKDTVSDIENQQLKLNKIAARVLSTREPIVISFLAIAIYIQVNVFNGTLSAVLPSLMFFYRAFNSFMNVQLSWTAYLKYAGSVKLVEDFETDLRTCVEKISGKQYTGFNDSLEFKEVSFHYKNGVNVVEDFSFKFKKNSTIAIVGKSGSGKTTISNLVTGLLKPSKGVITIDGTNIFDYNLNSYREKIGLISQETVVFNDTLYNNITFWAEKNAENLKRFNLVLAKVGLNDFLDKSSDQEDIMLGDHGVVMSGGQRQRLSIARELFKQTEILILDEATSALDSHTERLIQENIDSIKGSMTIIIIAHRLSTIKKADSILLLKDGKIEASGTFDELCVKSEMFASMVALQEI